jgi:aminoglycoside phosphotransferase (APT) family kinase protein
MHSVLFEGYGGPELEALVLSAYPVGTTVTAVEPYRSGYLRFPARVALALPDGAAGACVVKAGSPGERIAHEARVLVALAALGLPVPDVLAGPATLAQLGSATAAFVMRALPGEPLPWLGLSDLATADQTCRLLLEGVSRLHQLTPAVSAHPIAPHLLRRTLASELEALLRGSGAWLTLPGAREAVAYLQHAVPGIAGPLVFSNGDYNPLNFLHTDGRLSGFIDFEHACFEDPLLGFAKFIVWAYDDWGWGAGQKAGLVERALYQQNATRAEFLPHLVLRCLQTLRDAGAVPQHGDEGPQAATLRVLAASMAQI